MQFYNGTAGKFVKMTMDVVVIGISGVTNGGKTTAVRHIEKLFPRAAVVHSDDFFLEPGDRALEEVTHLNHHNWDNLSAINTDALFSKVSGEIANLKKIMDSLIMQDHVESKIPDATGPAVMSHAIATGGDSTRMSRNLNSDGCVILPSNADTVAYSKILHSFYHVPFVIVEGILIFNHGPLNRLFDKRFYFTVDKEESRKRRLSRVYDPADPPGYFDDVVWPMYLKYKQELLNNSVPFICVDGASGEVACVKVEAEIVKTLQERYTISTDQHG